MPNSVEIVEIGSLSQPAFHNGWLQCAHQKELFTVVQNNWPLRHGNEIANSTLLLEKLVPNTVFHFIS